jgi:aminomethyltransferase
MKWITSIDSVLKQEREYLMLKTPLYENHQALSAKLINFSGWAMPLYYQTQSIEHLKVRESVGVFDVSHMGIVDVEGPQARHFLSYVLANDIDKINVPGKALYSCMLNEHGGILDDLIVYHLAANQYRLIVNAARTREDYDWFLKQAKNYEVTLKQRVDFALLALQGRTARAILTSALNNAAITGLKPFCIASWGDYTIATTGYTGEDGFEILLPGDKAPAFWAQLLDLGVTPIGLGARDSLRLEAGLNLYGLDMDETVTPFESNLAWTVSLNNPERQFIGREALVAQQKSGIRKNLKAIKLLGKGMLRPGQRILNASGESLGTVTSASHSPLLKQSIGFARLPVDVPESCLVEIRGEHLPIACVKPPLWRKNYAVVFDTQTA